MSLLILKDLKKHYGGQEVLRGASLTIEPGTKVGIVGRNGGGKTTLFRMITGEATPDWGQVIVAKGTRLGFLPQHPNFSAKPSGSTWRVVWKRPVKPPSSCKKWERPWATPMASSSIA